MSPACINARAPPAEHRTASCSNDSSAWPLVSHTRHVLVGPHWRCPCADAPVTRRVVTRVASAETLLAWGMSASKTETLLWPECVRSFVRTRSGDDPKMSKKCRQSKRRRIPTEMCLTPGALPGDRGPGGSTSVSTVGGKSLATLRGSPSSVMTSPRGASRNAICRS